MIEEQKRREKARKRRSHTKLKKIRVLKFNEATGKEESVEILTPDHGTFREMWKRYGNNYLYYCAQISDFPLFPDPEASKSKAGKTYTRKWRRAQGNAVREDDFITGYGPSQLYPLEHYGSHTAWIDLERGCILVERAGENLK